MPQAFEGLGDPQDPLATESLKGYVFTLPEAVQRSQAAHRERSGVFDSVFPSSDTDERRSFQFFVGPLSTLQRLSVHDRQCLYPSVTSPLRVSAGMQSATDPKERTLLEGHESPLG